MWLSDILRDLAISLRSPVRRCRWLASDSTFIDACGCGNYRTALPKSHSGHLIKRLVQLPPCRSPAARLVDSIAPRNCFAAIDGADRDQLRAAGWWTIDVLNAGQAAKLIDGFGRDVVLNYLHSYISRRFEVCFDTDRLEASLWEDVSNWFGKIGRGKDVRIASAALVSPPA